MSATVSKGLTNLLKPSWLDHLFGFGRRLDQLVDRVGYSLSLSVIAIVGLTKRPRGAAKRFLNEYRSQLRPFEAEYEVAPGVLIQRTGGHTPGHSAVRLASGGERLTFAGDAVFQVGFEHPDWYNGFEHDPEEAARVRVRLLRELAANREPLVATHLSFPSICHVAVDGDVFRWVPGPWEY
jgi:glyoxylase-like metal-dependent hydrolase (beta-lactamase superfamily II)